MLDEALRQVFREALARDFAGLKHECLVENETSHGRVESRATHILQLPKNFALKQEWADLNTMVVVIRHWKHVGDEDFQEHGEQRTFISDHPFHSQTLRRAPRSHWSIENKLHWGLDVQLREDDYQLRGRNGGANLAFLRRLTVSLLQQDPKPKSARESKTTDSEPQPIPTTSSDYSLTPSFSAFALLGAPTLADALINLEQLDRLKAVETGKSNRSILEPTARMLGLTDGRRLYEQHIGRPTVTSGTRPAT